MESHVNTNISGLKRKLKESCVTKDHKSARMRTEHGPSSGPYLQNCHCFCSKLEPTLADNCINYLNSGLPRRIMYYNRNEWSDFPETVTCGLIKGFKEDKSSSTITMNGQDLLVDFLSMTLINLKNRKLRSLAWIDESGKCFFPSCFIDEEGDGLIGGAHEPEVIKRVVVESRPSVSGQVTSTAEILRSKIKLMERESEAFLFVQKLFLSGMGPFAGPGNIISIHRYTPDLNLILSEFEGARYGWLGCKKSELAGILIHGFGGSGSGVYLMPQDRAFASVNLCDDDEKGVQYMLLCHVVPSRVRSEQIHSGLLPNVPPGCKVHDSEPAPTYYLVHSSDLSACIHLEFVVSFKLSPLVREYLLGLKGIELHATPPPPLTAKTKPDSPSLDPESSETIKGPTSPWVSFPDLFSEIQDEISPIARELLFHHYDELKRRKITREELVKKMRIILGDKLLMSSLAKLQRCPSSWYDDSNTKLKHEDSSTPTSKLTSSLCVVNGDTLDSKNWNESATNVNLNLMSDDLSKQSKKRSPDFEAKISIPILHADLSKVDGRSPFG